MQQEESAKCAEEPLGLNDSSEPEGYRLIDVSCIKVLMSALLCSECVGSSLERTESGKGIHFEFVVLCTTCGEVARALHSVNIGDTRLNELAARIDLSARDSGVSFTKLSHLFTGINLPPPMCLKTAKKVAAKVHDAAVTAAGKVMRSAAQSVRKAKIVAKDELLDVCVTFDGTWHKRGHTSHFAVKATRTKVAKAQVKTLKSSTPSHKRRKMEAVAKAQKDHAEEGLTVVRHRRSEHVEKCSSGSSVQSTELTLQNLLTVTPVTRSKGMDDDEDKGSWAGESGDSSTTSKKSSQWSIAYGFVADIVFHLPPLLPAS
ncbi:hypothetical protein HPB47_002485 [Ixodes persulcatus]|uniref:Uncharacterized protein n=1 Tax=Ixodes persulcatus TaxID=34615 RepID=A0AC60PL30_IXOPE|nr:hypothetical protein HPB47_002485 [Ixodes persulcatus]